MWCNQCQQDVPAVASKEDGRQVCCARCGQRLVAGQQPDDQAAAREAAEDQQPEAVQPAQQPDEPATADAAPKQQLDTWQLEEDLEAVDRLLGSLEASGVIRRPEQQRTTVVHPPHGRVPDWHRAKAETDKQRAARRSLGAMVAVVVAWTFLLIGLMTLVCGAVLMGWSVAEQRDELWTIGLPLALGGQALLLVGLLFRLEGLWQRNEENAQVLDELDQQLSDLRRTAELLSTSHSEPARSFYFHMAEGASPEMLLADLKGQLDMLAVRLANTRR